MPYLHSRAGLGDLPVAGTGTDTPTCEMPDVMFKKMRCTVPGHVQARSLFTSIVEGTAWRSTHSIHWSRRIRISPSSRSSSCASAGRALIGRQAVCAEADNTFCLSSTVNVIFVVHHGVEHHCIAMLLMTVLSLTEDE